MVDPSLWHSFEYGTYYVCPGDEVLIKVFDQYGKETKDLTGYSIKVTEGAEIFERSKKTRPTFYARRLGQARLELVYDGYCTVSYTTVIIESLNKAYFCEDILPIFMRNHDKIRYHGCGIYSCRQLLDSIENKIASLKPSEEDLAVADLENPESMNLFNHYNTEIKPWVSENMERLYARQAALHELPDIDRNVALLAALAGVRNIFDLSRVNLEKAYSVFKVVSPMVRMFEGEGDIFEYPSDDVIKWTIERAHELTDFSSKYATYVAYDDPEPSYILDSSIKVKTDTDVIYEALQFLKNISISLPLPRTISGKVMLRKNNGDKVEQEGYKVTLTGIANPSSDKSEDDEDIHAYTDYEGKFVIVMPDKYNMQETLTFTITYDEAENRTTFMNLDESANSQKSAVVVKRASEIIKAEHINYYQRSVVTDAKGQESYNYVETDIPALLLLEKLDSLFDFSDRAKKLQDEIYEEATADFNLKELRKNIRNLQITQREDFVSIRDELSYHLYELEKERADVTADRKNWVVAFDASLRKDLSERILSRKERVRIETRKLKNSAKEEIENSLIKERLAKARHEIEIYEALKETCEEEDNELYRYLRDNNYNYDLEAPVPGSDGKVLRSELVHFLLKQTKKLVPTAMDYAAGLNKYDEELEQLQKKIDFLKDLVDFCIEQCNKPLELEDDGEEKTEEEAKVEAENKLERVENLTMVEREHNGTGDAIDEFEWFENQLAEFVDEGYCEEEIFNRKYKKYKIDTAELDRKVKQKEALTSKKKEVTKENIFEEYIKAHEDDSRVKEYIRYKDEAKKLFDEIQDIDDTVGVDGAVVSDVSEARRQRGDASTTPGAEGSDSEGYNEKKQGWKDSSVIQTAINNILSKSIDARFDEPFEEPFILSEERFIGTALKPRALPTVRLMGEGREEVELPTDTAPSRVFNYSILQRLVEPFIKEGNKQVPRIKIDVPIDVMDFKEKLYNVNENLPIASSLGIGYILNMHQAWIPDGFALGTLLYSMVLAPGEEQRVVVREHTETYTVRDDASVEDRIRDQYMNDQIDHETAAFEQAVLRASDANSEYATEATAKSASASASGGWGSFGASASASYSKNTAKGSASAAQNDSYDEISSAAQDFQTSIKTQSERLASENRVSIRVASSKETESVSSKIVANHNHSHVMTVQYWEVTRRYKMETCIEGIDLVLFVPLKPICFLPRELPESKKNDANFKNNFGGYNLNIAELLDSQSFTKEAFNYRYKSFIRYADALSNYIPSKYRGGVELIKKYSSYPNWRVQPYTNNDTQVYQLKLVGNFLEFDDISATMHFNKSKETIAGDLEYNTFHEIHPSMNTRKDVIYAMKKLRTGFNARKYVDVSYTEKVDIGWDVKIEKERSSSLDMYKTKKVRETPVRIYTFYIPPHLSPDDVAYIEIENNLTSYDFNLCQSRVYLQDHEIKAIENYEDKLWDFAKDDNKSGRDERRMAHYAQALPECYTNPLQSFTRSDLISIGGTKIKAYIAKDQTFTEKKTEDEDSKKFKYGLEYLMFGSKENKVKVETEEDFKTVAGSSQKLLASPVRINISSHIPVLGYDELMKMEETFRHVTNNTMRYSQVIWHSLSEVERTMMLEQYTVDLDYAKLCDDPKAPADQAKREPVKVPLLNCINVHKPMGFYGNSMIFPFTYPQELAEKLGKTAGDIQDELYRYHTTNFRVPSTSISVPTKGMIGEAVLGRTNVSEKIDITRFWNWKDSDIDHIELNQNALNGRSLLENADTKDAVAPTQGVVATEHVNGSGLLNSLTSRAQPQFADVLSNTDIRSLVQNADNNATAGREQAVQATSDMTKSAITAASDIAKTVANKAASAANRVGDLDNLKNNLKEFGLSEDKVKELANKMSTGEMSYSDAFAAALKAKEEGSSGGGSGTTPPSGDPGSGGGGDTGSGSKSGALSEILEYAQKGIAEDKSPVDIFNSWMQEKTGDTKKYTEDEIKKIAEDYCKSNGTTMDEVISLIDGLCKG